MVEGWWLSGVVVNSGDEVVECWNGGAAATCSVLIMFGCWVWALVM